MMQDVPRREEDKPSPFSIKARQIITVEDRTFVLTQDTNELIAWGGNERGQLGLGHYSDVHIPEKIDYFSKPGNHVTSIAGGGDLTLACTENGDSYAWPFVKNGQKYSNPVRMPFSEKINISRVSCGYNFGFFISSQGLVYSVGKDNSDGQLGLGHIYPNDIPELVCCFKEAGERIDSIECGFRHAIARSTLGKVYTWGWNKFGQLGHDTFDSELSPRLLRLERGKLNKDKAV
jgi:alpha-tubulin suppressor-like RCC1 family protein